MFRTRILSVAFVVACFTIAGICQAQTNYTGPNGGDINAGGNWDNGVPTNTGANDGTVPAGKTNLTGSPQNKNIVFNGTSSYSGGNFGGGQANGYDVTFNGSSSANFTGNGLFLAWDGGAANTSDFTWNSTGTANTTRFFASRFGAGTFTQSAGTINQNSGGGFDMVVGEFAPGVNWTMTGGTFNSAASEFELRHGSITQSGGTINANNLRWDEGGGGSSFTWDFSGGTVNGTDVNGFNASDVFNFVSTGPGDGILNVLNSNYSLADALADIAAGHITVDGGLPTVGTGIGELNVSLFNDGNFDFTQLQLVQPPPREEVVPEPASVAIWSLMGLMAGLYGWRRKRAKA